MKKNRIIAAVSSAAIFAGMLTSFSVSFASETILTVGAGDGYDYSTIVGAVAKAKEINPQSTSEQVIINVAPGDYEEQVVFENIKYVTLQQTPGTEGTVDLHWYYCTGYAAANCDLSGKYNADMDWYKNPPKDANGKTYRIGELVPGGTELTYTTVSGEEKKETVRNDSYLGNTGGLDKMATLILRNGAENITIKDLNVVNSVPVFATQGEKDGHLTPTDGFPNLPDRSKLANCTEYTVEEPITSMGEVSKDKYNAYVESNTLTPGQSVWLARSGAFNERGHAVAYTGSADKITFENIRLRGGQDSLYAAGRRAYFKNCDVIGGTDYIYGGGTAVFDNCKLGLEGFSDKQYGSPIATGGHSVQRMYGYLFYNCMLYNVRDNNGTNNYGGPWQAGSQVTYYNCVIDDNGTVGNSPFKLDEKGWRRFGAENGLSKSYEYGTTNISGNPVDFSKRVVNKSAEEGGPGMGTVLDRWQVLEFNPRNYFSKECDKDFADDWDPMNFSAELAKVDAAIASADVTVPAGEATSVDLPAAPEGITYKWLSASSNAVVSEDGTKLNVIRPAAGEAAINTTVTLYAMDNEKKIGDKKDVSVTINPTTDTTNVFSIPVKIDQSTNAENKYTVTITKNGALIKTAEVAVTGGVNIAEATIEGIPASSEGIDYDVKIVSESDAFAVTAPEDGKTSIKGITGQNVELNIISQKLVDKTVDLGINTSASAGNKTYDLISLAKAAGATDEILTSDTITVQFDVPIDAAMSNGSFVDISSGTPSNANGAVAARFAMFKINNSWHQVDAVSNAQGFSGSSNTENMCLNVTGKYQNIYPAKNTVRAIINYKEGSVTVDGDNNGGSGQSKVPYKFESFPENVEKGNVNMGLFVGSTSDQFSLSNVKVTYKAVVTGDELEATPTPKPTDAPATDAPATEDPGTIVAPGGDAYTINADTPAAAGSVYTDNANLKVAGEFATTVNAAGAGGAAVEFDGKTFTHSLNVRLDGKDPDKGDYTEKAGSTPLHIDAKVNGTFTIYYRRQVGTEAAADGKDIKLSHKNGAAVEAAAAGEFRNLGYTDDTNAYFYAKQTWTLKSGESYLLWARGTTGTLYSYEFVPEGGETVTDAPATEKPTEEATKVPVTEKPTEEATKVPVTENPTEEATQEPTSTPDMTKRIVSAYKDNGNTIVKLVNITEGIVIAASYDENGVLKQMKSAAVNGSDITIEGIEADKVFVWDSLEKMQPICDGAAVADTAPSTDAPVTDVPSTDVPDETQAPTAKPGEAVTVDFTVMSAVPVYSAEAGQGFVAKSGAIMPEGYQRTVASADKISVSSEGAKITETNGSYLHAKTNSNDGDDFNNGGLIYRIDTGAPGAYHLEVEVTGTSADTRVAPTGMNSGNLTGKSNWDNCGMTPRTVSASWNGSVWSYDFGTGESFVEIEIEPTVLANADKPQTVGVKKITVTPLEKNAAGDKPTIHILGDSTQKSYSFNETISSWGQTLKNYFDLDKINVVNYSMGGRAMKSNYCEGRFDEILISGHEGDYVFIHSAHNDETVSTNRFSRGAGSVKDDFEINNANYNKWLDMYVEAIKARGMVPVLVTGMPRINSSTGKYNSGFNPDSPANMKAKAKADSDVAVADLCEGAKAYIDMFGNGKEIGYIYNSVEAGETPANNSANGANGDGTHYREAAAKQFCRIILKSIYDQANAAADEYTDKAIMQSLVPYMKDGVAAAAESGDWSAVFPEMASDVSAVGVIPGAEQQPESSFYYRTSIEKALQLGVLHKDNDNLFKPTQTITVGEFARGMEKAFGLEENALTSYTKTYAELQAEGAAVNENAAMSAAEDMAIAEGGEAAGDGEIVVTVEQPAGGVVTVYNESAYKTSTTDITGSETSGQVIADNEYYTLTAPSEIAGGTDKGGVFAGNSDVSTGYVEFRNNGTKEFTYTAKADGTLTVYGRVGGNKTVELKPESGTTQSSYINDSIEPVEGSNVYGTIHFNVTAGTTYQLYTRGGTGRLYGIEYASNNYPQSTSTLYANIGDTIRVVAAPSENYVNGSIIVNGEEISTSKEAVFELTGETTVTAAFISEPALVETTVIASDAALTREAMGAILYDAYQLADKTIMSQYMGQNGGVPTPDDPNYDPNIKYEGSPYIPLTGWGALTDKGELTDSLYAKVKAAYNAGLIRPETGIARGSIALGTELEPKAEVTRAKAAKALVFCYTLTQPLSNESQMIPGGINHAAEAAEISAPNADALSVPMM